MVIIMFVPNGRENELVDLTGLFNCQCIDDKELVSLIQNPELDVMLLRDDLRSTCYVNFAKQGFQGICW